MLEPALLDAEDALRLSPQEVGNGRSRPRIPPRKRPVVACMGTHEARVARAILRVPEGREAHFAIVASGTSTCVDTACANQRENSRVVQT